MLDYMMAQTIYEDRQRELQELQRLVEAREAGRVYEQPGLARRVYQRVLAAVGQRVNGARPEPQTQPC